MPTVLVSAAPPSSAADLRRAVADAGFVVSEHAFGSVPAVDFGSVAAAVIEVGDRADAAASQTRRWRAELGDHIVPILWALPAPSPDLAVRGFEAGADACLARPFEPGVFAAQVRAMVRAHAAGSRLGAKAAEARLLGDQLRKAYSQLDAEGETARRIHRLSTPHTFPPVGAARASVCHRPQGRAGGDFYDVRRLDEDHVGFFIGDVVGRGTAAGNLLGLFVKQAARLKEIIGDGYRLVPPNEVLAGVNRELIGLGLDDPPLVAMLAGTLDVRDGAIVVARAGLPAPVFLPATGEPEPWPVPGPFLGTAEAGYACRGDRMSLGDKLVIGSDGTRPDGEPAGDPDRLIEAAVRHRALSGQAFVDAVARDLLPHVRHADDFTLLAVEMAGGSSSALRLSQPAGPV